MTHPDPRPSKHTPGHWQLFLHDDGRFEIADADGSRIADVFTTVEWDARYQEDVGNAYLMKATPLLLAAAKQAAALLLEMQRDLPEMKDTINAVLRPLHEAIGEAEGKPIHAG